MSKTKYKHACSKLNRDQENKYREFFVCTGNITFLGLPSSATPRHLYKRLMKTWCRIDVAETGTKCLTKKNRSTSETKMEPIVHIKMSSASYCQGQT